MTPCVKSRARLSARERVIGSRRCHPNPCGGSRYQCRSERCRGWPSARVDGWGRGNRLPAVTLIRTPTARSDFGGRRSLFTARYGGQMRRAVGDLCRPNLVQDAADSLAKPLPSASVFRCALHARRLAWEIAGDETEEGWRSPPNG